jgi:hypothetical protein
MTLLALLLAVNAVLHAMVVIRFGPRDNIPYVLFAFIYAALSVAVFLAVPYILWAVVALGLLGLLGLTMTIGKLKRDKALDRIIWLLDIGIIAYTASLLYAALAA